MKKNSASLPKPEPHLPDPETRAAQAEARGDWETAAHEYAQLFRQHEAEFALINSVQEGLSSRLEMQSIYDLVGDKLRDTFNAQVVMISQYDPQTNMVFHHYAIESGRHLHIPDWLPIDSSRLEIVRTRKPFMINLAEIIRLVEASKMQVVPGTQLPKTWMGVPMLVGSEVRGIVSLQNLDEENAFTQSDISLLTTLTNSMALSLENARLFNETQRLLSLLEREMELARQTQLSILPIQSPSHPAYDCGCLIIPARAVGGDFYDFIPLDDRRSCIVIGDVSYKGLPAALFMSLTVSLVRVETERTDDPLEILQNVNRSLLKMNASGIFITLLFGVLDYETGLFRYARAGHLPPIVLDSAGSFVHVPMDRGQPLGLFADAKIDRQQFYIPQGGLALLFSDGLNEAADSGGQEFGFDRIRQELYSHRHETAQDICQLLWQAVHSYSRQELYQDDFTTVVIKRRL
jgi:serine phosphatase RsbU (regulator of sigma subunit)